MKINRLIKILIAISILLFSVNISSAAGLEPPLKVAIANVLSGWPCRSK
jgi:hypothetical protein